MPSCPSFLRAALIAAALAFLVVPPADASAPARKGPVAEAFVSFDVLTVSVLQHRRTRGFLVLEVVLHVPEHDDQAKAAKIKPILQDAFVRQLVDYGSHVAVVDRPPDLPSIAQRLQSEVDRLLAPGRARVLITQAQVRPLA